MKWQRVPLVAMVADGDDDDHHGAADDDDLQEGGDDGDLRADEEL